MTTGRRALVYALLAVIVGGHVYDIVSGEEHWPFSPNPMYAHARGDFALDAGWLVGVRADTLDEIPLWDERYLAPFDRARLDEAVRAIAAEPGGDARVVTALADCLVRYERRRRAGAHDGPPLAGLRLYAGHWQLDPAARNAAAPDTRRPVAEFMAPPPAS